MKDKKFERKTDGDCYQSAYRQIVHFANQGVDGFFLVHGTVYSVPWRKRIGHAWVECGVVVIDTTLSIPAYTKNEYYKMGDVKADKRYSSRQAVKLAVETGNYGPWEEKNE